MKIMKTMKIKRILIIFAEVLCMFLFCSILPAEQNNKIPEIDSQRTFNVNDLKEDFQLLYTAIIEGHAGLHRYTSKQEFERLFKTCLNQITQPLNERRFFLLLAPLIANINDGHTRLEFSSSHVDYLKRQPILLPFKLKFIKGNAYLHRNYSSNTDQVMGGEVISINSRPMSSILDQMLPLISSDGHISSSKFRQLESTIFFGSLYYILFGETTSYTIVYRLPGKKDINTIKCRGQRQDEVLAVFEKRYPEDAKNKIPIELHYKGTTAILTIRSFGGGYENAGISYPDFLKAAFWAFQQKNVKNLVIDLRNNSGGRDEYGKILVAYLMDKPFQYYNYLEVKQEKHSFWRYTNLPDGEKELAKWIKKNNRGTYDVWKHPNLGIQQLLKPTFKGNVFILVDGGSFSATGECTSLIHFYKRACFVGEECGAGYYGNTSGFMPELTLPHTRLRIRIPMVKYAMAVSGYPPDRGIIPDYPVVPEMNNLLAGRDTEMEFVLDLVAKTN